MEDLPDEALLAAATALFEHSLIAGWNPEKKARLWLENADQYRELARAALVAALPYLKAG